MAACSGPFCRPPAVCYDGLVMEINALRSPTAYNRPRVYRSGCWGLLFSREGHPLGSRVTMMNFNQLVRISIAVAQVLDA